MPDSQYNVGDCFRTQFVWRLPSNDFLRAIFRVEVLQLDHISDKYVVRLDEFEAGRQESASGEIRPAQEVNRTYWKMVDALSGNTISLAFEVDDGRPLWLRFETLTGEHNFFSRLNQLPPNFREWKSDRSSPD